MNIRSIKGKLTEVQSLDVHDIVCITETHLDQTIGSGEILSSDLYSMYRKDRNIHGGGVLIAVKKTIPHTSCPIGGILEAAGIILTGKLCQPIIIVYRPPSENSTYMDDLLSNVSSSITILNLSVQNISMMLLGDFNYPGINWKTDPPTLKPSTHTKSLHQAFIDTALEHNFVQLIKEPTHMLGNTLDLILVKRITIETILVLPCSLSDHSPISFELPHNPHKKLQVIKYTMPDFYKTDPELFRKILKAGLPENKSLCETNGPINKA